MYYYAYIDDSNTCTGVYALPSEITNDSYVAITAEQYNTQSVVGKVWDAETQTWNDPIIFACTTDEVDYKGTGSTLTTKLDAMDSAIAGKAGTADLHSHDNKSVLDGITAAKVALWDSGTAGADGADGADGEDGATFTPSVSAEGVLSWTNDKGLPNPTPVNIKGADGADGTNGTNGTDGADGTTVVVGTTTTGNAGTNASVTGVLNSETNTLTLNFVIPKGADGADGESGADVTASDILTKLKTVDGQNSGLDADMLDGHDTEYFATATQLSGKADADHTHTEYAAANHTHTGYAATDHTHTEYAAANHTHTEYAAASHTHSGYATTESVTAVENALDGKASASHTHAQSDITGLTNALASKANASHTHAQSDITGLATALSGKADTDHTHSEYAASNHTHSGYADSSHTHSQKDITGLVNALSGKASTSHTHSEYAESSHTHSQSDITGLASALNGKADTDHTHSGYATITALNNLSNTVDGKADASHTHSQSDITGLSTALAGKASTSHTHSEYASTSHNHDSDYLSLSGGTVSGELNLSNGLLRLKGVQTLFHSGSQLVFGSNSLPTRIAGNAISATQTITVDSDERLKENIVAVDKKACAELINGIDVKTFNYIGKETECIGVIAQELQAANPELAKYFVSEDEKGYLGVKVADLVFPLIAAVQELTKRLNDLESKN